MNNTAWARILFIISRGRKISPSGNEKGNNTFWQFFFSDSSFHNFPSKKVFQMTFIATTGQKDKFARLLK